MQITEEKRQAGLVVSWALIVMGTSFLVPIAFPQLFPANRAPDGVLALLAIVAIVAAYLFYPRPEER